MPKPRKKSTKYGRQPPYKHYRAGFKTATNVRTLTTSEGVVEIRVKHIENIDAYSDDQQEFILACGREMEKLGARQLTPGQILAVAKRLGYRKR